MTEYMKHEHNLSRRSFVKSLATVSASAALTPWVLGNENGDKKQPNVLMICIDDLNDWIGCLGGHPDVKTPNIDRLAKSGRLFANAHCCVPVCSPSRTCIMSGMHATSTGSYELGPAYEDLPALQDVPTLQAYFKKHGYQTLSGGKVLHHGFKGRLKADIDVDLGRHGGPSPKKAMNWPRRVWDFGPYPEKDEQMKDYTLAVNAAEKLAMPFDKPFFMSVGFYRPHVPMFVPPKWFDLYDRDAITLPKAPPEDMDDVPPNLQKIPAAAPTHKEVLESGKWRDFVHAYLACVSFADMCVGTVLDGLEKGPNKDDTIVVLWSDHGFHLGEKQHWAKRTLWEESTRTPLIFAGPGVEPGEICSQPASLLDIYPTLVELCGLSPNQYLEGVSLVPQIADPAAKRVKPVISSSFFGNHAIRDGKWRCIRYKDGAEELYNHETDPDEFTNLAGNPEYAPIKAELAGHFPEKQLPEYFTKNTRKRNHHK